MSRNAVDIVLLPSGSLLDLALTLNKQAIDAGAQYQLLGTTDFIPHLSLLQGVTTKKLLPNMIEVLQTLSSKHSATELVLSQSQQNWIELEKTESLMKLQQEVVQVIDPFLTHDATAADYVKDPGETEIHTDCFPWLNDVIGTFSSKHYHPHITTGNSSPNTHIPLPQSYVESHIALCSLGRYNTCRNILWSNQQHTTL